MSSLSPPSTGSRESVADVVLHWVSREHGLAEVGYVVHPDHAGRGYATEATRPLLAVAFDALRLHRVIGRTEGRNIGSARVLEKLGMRREAHLVENEFVKDEWQSELRLRHPRPRVARGRLNARSGHAASSGCTAVARRLPTMLSSQRCETPH